MKKFAFILLVSCNSINDSTLNTSYDKVDSIISVSVNAKNNIQKISDSTTNLISNKIDKTATTITNLKEEVKELKNENEALKSVIDDNDNVGKPFDLRPISNNKGN